MSSPADTAQDHGIDILEEACARNLAIEIHHTTMTDELLVARSRILNLDEETLFIDKPHSVGQHFNFARGKTISVYFQLNGVQYTFRSRITQSECIIDLNEEKQVEGIGIGRPAKIDEGQRREDFRISLACIEPIEVRLHEVTDIHAGYCNVDVARFNGRMVDASRGGLCVLVEVSEKRNFREGEHYCISCVLPDQFLEITLLVQLRHTRRVCQGEATRLGLKFIPWATDMTRPFMQDFARFCADLERQAAKRMR